MKSLYLTCLFLILTLAVHAQYENVIIHQGGGYNEPSICINPKNTSEIVAGSNIREVFTSDDCGRTWTHTFLQSTYGVNGDPCIIADTAGVFYYFHLSDPPSGYWIDRIVCQRSLNSGQSWSAGTFMGLFPPKHQDKEWAIVDPANNNIYVTWTLFDNYGSADPLDSTIIFFSKSTDQALTWSNPLRLNRKAGDCLDMDNTVEGAVPAVGPEGQIYVSWAGPDGLVFDRSTDEGNTWLDEDIFVSDIPGGWDYAIPGIYRANGLPVTCCDISEGPHGGNIYINWTDQRNGETDTDVWFKKSTDGGDTWSELKRVNDDPPGKQQFFTWMTVDQLTGNIYIIFYDRRNYNNNSTDVYLATSTDGGETFINEKLSTTPFIPNQSVFFGDYTNISAVQGVVRPIWTRMDGTVTSLLTAIVGQPAGVADKDAAMVSVTLDDSYPNPVKDITYIPFKLHSTEYVTIRIFDIFGREAAIVANEELLGKGKHQKIFNTSSHNLSPGIYFIHLTAGETTVVRKLNVE